MNPASNFVGLIDYDYTSIRFSWATGSGAEGTKKAYNYSMIFCDQSKPTSFNL
jgi:hypothetical protein